VLKCGSLTSLKKNSTTDDRAIPLTQYGTECAKQVSGCQALKGSKEIQE